MDWSILDDRPIIVAVAGPNGAGKSSFYEAHLKRTGLPFVNADILAREHSLDPYVAADAAAVLRSDYLSRSESFIFETVFSDPVGDKVSFLKDVAEEGYHVVLCFIGLAGSELSEQRVCMRVSQGGHDVPVDKIQSRFPRTLANLGLALRELPHVIVYDNSDLAEPYRQVAWFESGVPKMLAADIPYWFSHLHSDQSI